MDYWAPVSTLKIFRGGRISVTVHCWPAWMPGQLIGKPLGMTLQDRRCIMHTTPNGAQPAACLPALSAKLALAAAWEHGESAWWVRIVCQCGQSQAARLRFNRRTCRLAYPPCSPPQNPTTCCSLGSNPCSTRNTCPQPAVQVGLAFCPLTWRTSGWGSVSSGRSWGRQEGR